MDLDPSKGLREQNERGTALAANGHAESMTPISIEMTTIKVRTRTDLLDAPTAGRENA